MTEWDWSGTEVPTEKERGYASAILDVINEAPTREFAAEFLARSLAAHRARAADEAHAMHEGEDDDE